MNESPLLRLCMPVMHVTQGLTSFTVITVFHQHFIYNTVLFFIFETLYLNSPWLMPFWNSMVGMTHACITHAYTTPCVAHSLSHRNSWAWFLALAKTVNGRSRQVATIHFSLIPIAHALPKTHNLPLPLFLTVPLSLNHPLPCLSSQDWDNYRIATWSLCTYLSVSLNRFFPVMFKLSFIDITKVRPLHAQACLSQRGRGFVKYSLKSNKAWRTLSQLVTKRI